MPSFIVKATPHDDIYCEWSTVVDAPTFVGTRAEMRDWLLQPKDVPGVGRVSAYESDVDARLARTDQHGTSAEYRVDGTTAIPGYRPYGFLDHGWVVCVHEVGALGTLRRDRLVEFLRTADPTLLEPFDDD
jgi:hypothetical protein